MTPSLVCWLQDDPVTNAGYGSNLTAAGSVECDACIMAGDGTLAAVGALPGVSRPCWWCWLAWCGLMHSHYSMAASCKEATAPAFSAEGDPAAAGHVENTVLTKHTPSPCPRRRCCCASGVDNPIAAAHCLAQAQKTPLPCGLVRPV